MSEQPAPDDDQYLGRVSAVDVARFHGGEITKDQLLARIKPGVDPRLLDDFGKWKDRAA